ncbi:glycoside hydrolase family 26 protein [Actinacidiphila acididurans]|uniref:Glycosyl hydrolase family 26 n=1 Tax=Actinacidiphila acididurans TaxID=2784346 RepID=A0ABS2TU29_9ACTN|nr:glycosyl hydrolase [Actinacidiphila acididurans]MBM9505790.1 glycosyl hydrolase family 26 [Actinacidiphila acididurans]
MAEWRAWRVRAGLAVATAALALTGLASIALGDDASSAVGRTRAAPSAAVSAPRSAVAAARARTVVLPPMGAFTDAGADGIRLIAALQTWLGGTEMRVGHTYLPGDSWQGIEGGTGLLEPWAAWRKAATHRLFVLNVPMQQDNEGAVSNARVRALIRAGAAGANDAHFTRLARRLVRLGVPDTVIVLGWEMNGTTYTHRCAPDPAGWKAYWKRIVAAMRAVPGQRFRFDFAPSRGRDAIGWTACYPGDATVDVIGMDSYDQPPGASFHQQVTEPYGLQAQVNFAARHHKAISYPEWGLFRNGDDPQWMRQMLGWIEAHHPLYQTITDYCPHGVWSCRANPKSSAVYRAALFGKRPPA